jgi:hypothetical protein
MFFMTTSHPRVPSLDIAVFTIAKCLYISHLCGLSGIPPTIVVIFDRWSPEHMPIFEDAGLAANALAATTAAAMTAYFIGTPWEETGEFCDRKDTLLLTAHFD